MGEIKSVKVDNWGVFFLQKLQNFFNKTDYCDLTLQFRDNSQLKVHRLVLSACTDYFNVLEHTCEMVDDALIMPNELQADVVVPIVNFMYTGTLEFELKMYGKLLRTAKEMNMTVLLKLLEAHRRTMEGVNRSQRPPSPKTIRRRGLNAAPTGANQSQHQSPQRRILTTSNVSVQSQRRPMQTQTKASGAGPASSQQFRQQIGSTSLLRSVPSKAQYEQQFKQEPELDFDSSGSTTATSPRKQPTSPFEQLRKGYNNNKRPTTTSFVSPPAKKPNIEDVKEFAEQQRMRKQIAAEYGGDDPDYEGMLEDDDIHNDDDDDDVAAAGLASSAAAAATTSTTTVQATTSRQTGTQQQLQAGSATITFRQEQNDKPPTIVVKDSSNSKMNHAKIISEVLRQYPHLVKSNKNIKLKIMPNVSGQSHKIIVNKDVGAAAPEEEGGGRDQQTKQDETTSLKSGVKPLQRASHEQQQPQKLPVLKPAVSTGAGTNDGSAAAGVNTPQKRRIDSKTMHALIAQGAENTTGPWLCLRCGVSGRPISIPSYRSFRRHLVNTHKEVIDPLLCELCGWRACSKRELHFHLQKDHNVNTSLFAFPDCLLCAEQFIDTNALNQHMLDSHPDENKQQCIYCNKIFAKELQLFIHMKTFHKNQAHDDGIIDFSDEEFVGSQDDELEEEMEQHEEYAGKKDAKVKILSDISLPSTSGGLLKLEPSSEAAGLSTLASGIATSIGIAADEYMHAGGNAAAAIGPDTKFVNADGNEMLLTEDQRKEIIAQLNQHHDSSAGVIMVLNEQVFAAETAAIAPAVPDGSQSQSDDGEREESGEEDAGEEASGDYDDSEIYDELMVEGSHATVGRQSREAKKPQPDESKESIEHMEWAENLISAHEMADEADNERKIAAAAEEKAKKDDVISKKLKELTGDWSDDDDEEGDVEDESDEVREEALAAEDVKTEAQADEHVDEEEHGKPAQQQLVAEETEEEEEEDEEMVEATESGEREIEEKREDTSIDDAATADAESVDNLTAEEPSVEEDELELAMKSMHKDDLDVKQLGTDAAKSAVEDIANATENADAKEVGLEMPTDVDDEIKTETDANESFEEEFLAVSKQSNETCTQDEEVHEGFEPVAAVEESKEAVAYKSKDAVALETSKNNAAIETPIDEQISVKADENEDEAKADVSDKPQRAFPIGMPSLDDDVKDEDEDIVDKTLSGAQQKHTEHDDGTLEADLNAAAVAPDKVEAVNETVEDVVTETADAISNKNSHAKAPTITIDSKSTASTSTTSGDKVKSLISEWADDDDEDDDEQDTVAIGELVHDHIEDYDEPEQL